MVSGSQFLSSARLSPDGRRLAWIAWNHPQMPWDGTELRVGDVVDGHCPDWSVLAGSTTESVLQPEWIDDDRLWLLSDRSGALKVGFAADVSVLSGRWAAPGTDPWPTAGCSPFARSAPTP